MAVYITKRQSWIRFLVSIVPGAAAAALLCGFFSGPRLGRHYDFLMEKRTSLPVSSELLLIDTAGPPSASAPGETANILEPSAAASALLTAAELGASTLIIEAPVLGLSAGGSPGEEEIRYRFNEEFDVLSKNIRSLFDAIRTGSVVPGDAAMYVSELVELSGMAKERLVSSLVSKDEEGLKLLAQAEKVFGNVRRPGDLLVQVIGAPGETPRPEADRGEYFRAKPDGDGVIRRVAPARKNPGGGEVFHIVYGALKGRYKNSGVERTDEGVFLVSREGLYNPADGEGGMIPLDKDDALLFEIPRVKNADFRKIEIKDFLDYDEAGRSLRRLLGEAEVLGAYGGLAGEENPMYLWDYALSLRADLLENPGEEKKAAWITARSIFFESLDSFLYGPAEMNLVSAYEEMIAGEDIGEEGETRLAGFRDTLIRAFIALRQKHSEMVELRNKLMVLDGAFCILGSFSEPALGDAEVSALLANSLLTGRAVRPGGDLRLLFAACLCALITALCIRPLGAARGLLLGIFLSFFSGAFFAASFVLTGLWLDPLVPAAAAAALTVFSFFFNLALKLRFSRLFRACYGACISRLYLKKLILAGRPKPHEEITSRAAVVAVRNPGLSTLADKTSPGSGAAAFLSFREKAANEFREAGAVILGSDGDIVLACFGSPLERAALGGGKNPSLYEGHIHAKDAPAVKAAAFVSELIKKEENDLWQFGMDIGNCCFTWSALSGYSGFGRPVVRARILAGLASRYASRFLITEPASAALPDLPAKKIAVLKSADDPGGEAFYQLNV